MTTIADIVARAPHARATPPTGSPAGEVLALNPGMLTDPSPAVEEAMASFRRAVRGWPRLAYERGRAALEALRLAAAARFGGDPDGWALADGATATADRLADALARVLGGAGRPIVVATTDAEHIGGIGAFSSDPRFRVIEVEPARLAVTPARVCFVSHLSYDTNRDHTAAILRLARRPDRPIVIVDGSQALGQVAVDVAALGCHAYFASAHKWLAGPQGSGLLYLRDDVRGAWPSPLRAGEPLCTSLPIGRWEPRGGQDFARIAGLTAAIREPAGAPPVALRALFMGGLLGRLGPRVRIDPRSAPGGRVVVFGIDGVDVYEVGEACARRGVVMKCIKRETTSGPLEVLRAGLPSWAREEHVSRAAATIARVVRDLDRRRA